MSQAPLLVVRHRALRLLDLGEELSEQAQFGNVSSFADLQCVADRQIEWAAAVGVFVAKSSKTIDVAEEHLRLPAAISVDESMSRGEAIRRLQISIEERVTFLNALADRLMQAAQLRYLRG